MAARGPRPTGRALMMILTWRIYRPHVQYEKEKEKEKDRNQMEKIDMKQSQNARARAPPPLNATIKKWAASVTTCLTENDRDGRVGQSVVSHLLRA